MIGFHAFVLYGCMDVWMWMNWVIFEKSNVFYYLISDIYLPAFHWHGSSKSVHEVTLLK